MFTQRFFVVSPEELWSPVWAVHYFAMVHQLDFGAIILSHHTKENVLKVEVILEFEVWMNE